MRVGIGRFLGWVMAVSAAGLTACTVETATSGLGATSGTTTGGSAGSSGTTTSSSMGAAGSTTSAGGATTTSTGAAGSEAGDSGGSGGSPNDGGVSDVSIDAAPSDASEGGSAACFPEDLAGGDAGTSPCGQLPYYAVTCTDDAGTMDQPLGAFICDSYVHDLKIAAFNELFDCLKVVPGDDAGTTACSPAHDAAANACATRIFNRTTCTVPDVTLDGGTFGCAQVVA